MATKKKKKNEAVQALNIVEALSAVTKEKSISMDLVLDSLKDALASAVEIAIKPRASRSSQDFMETNVISIHSKFGGIS